MKHRMLIITIALTAVVIGSSAITVSAQDQPAGKPGHEGHHRPMMGLLPPPMVEKLTADQKTKYDAILKDGPPGRGGRGWGGSGDRGRGPSSRRGPSSSQPASAPVQQF